MKEFKNALKSFINFKQFNNSGYNVVKPKESIETNWMHHMDINDTALLESVSYMYEGVVLFEDDLVLEAWNTQTVGRAAKGALAGAALGGGAGTAYAMKKFGPQITAAKKKIEAAKTPEEKQKAQQELKDLKKKFIGTGIKSGLAGGVVGTMAGQAYDGYKSSPSHKG
jgi:hypothetical protein